MHGGSVRSKSFACQPERPGVSFPPASQRFSEPALLPSIGFLNSKFAAIRARSWASRFDANSICRRFVGRCSLGSFSNSPAGRILFAAGLKQ